MYSDIDTTSLIPIEDWVPSAYVNKVNLVIGVEYDKLDGGRRGDFTLDLQFCTWAILAKPGHLLMEMTVDRVLSRLKGLAQQQETTTSGIRASYREVLNTTGPGLFTEAVIEGLAFTTGTNFTWQNLTGMTESKIVGDGTYFPWPSFLFWSVFCVWRDASGLLTLPTCFEARRSHLGIAMLISEMFNSAYTADKCFRIRPNAL